MDFSKILPEVANKKAGYLLFGLVLLSALLGGLGIAEDELPDLLRDHPVLTYASIICILLAIGLGMAAGWIAAVDSLPERIFLYSGTALLIAGLILGALAAGADASDSPKPEVSATILHTGEGAVLLVEYSARGLSPSEAIRLRVEPLATAEDGFRVHAPLYSATLSPDDKGLIEGEKRIRIPFGDFDHIGVRTWKEAFPRGCYDTESTTGCVDLLIDRSPEDPQLQTSWKRISPRRLDLVLQVSAKDITPRGLHFLVLAGQPARQRAVAEGSLYPDALGQVARTLTVAIPNGARQICVVAATNDATPQCPGRSRRSSWLRLAIPGRG